MLDRDIEIDRDWLDEYVHIDDLPDTDTARALLDELVRTVWIEGKHTPQEGVVDILKSLYAVIDHFPSDDVTAFLAAK